MAASLRIAGVIALACLVTNAAFAAPEARPAWMEPCELPSMTDKTSLDDRIQLAGHEESAGSVSCGDCGDGGNDCSGNDCAAGQMDCGCESTWDVTAGAIFLHRSRPGQGAILTPIGGGGIISNAGDFGFDWDAGPDVSISKQMANGWIWDVRYFNDHGSGATADYPGITGAHVFGINVLGITSLTANYFTKLDSGEINLCKPMNDVFSFLGGFRWIEVQDRLSYRYNNGVLITTFDDNNRLFGGQLGMNLALLNSDSRLRLNAAFKAGAYSNFAENNFTANAIFASNSSNRSPVAFVGDIDISASYQLTKHCAIRGGYQLLWIDELALAGNNAVSAAATGLGSGINTDGPLFYNGATAAVEFAW